MSDQTGPSIKRLRPSGWALRRVRLATGIVLFTFAATHLLNHALGLVSLEVMEQVRLYRTAITRSAPGSALLLVSLITHLVLGLRSFARRRVARMRLEEGIQLVFGVLIPLLLFKHVIGTRFAHELYGVNDNYVHALFAIWPANALNQLTLIVLVWVHGCIGMHAWLHMKPGYRRALPAIFAVAVLIPVLGFAGFTVAGRRIREVEEYVPPLTSDQFANLLAMMDWAFWGYLGLLAAFVAFHALRLATRRFQPRIRITYPGGLIAAIAPGATLLEVSRAHGIPHASVCGGRARCSTCRVRILDGIEHQPEATETEREVLARVGATDNVRLACQLRPAADLSIVPLLPDHRTSAADVHKLDKYFWGVEQTVTLMFTDIRGFTRLTEAHLPYDVVFLLNQYLGRMSEAITDAGGYVDKFMGDGIMAIFGMDDEDGQGAAEALRAALDISAAVDELNAVHEATLAEPLRIGIGIHTGEAILGRIGTSKAHTAGERITALGDTVNTASRLEALTKELGQEIVVSANVLRTANVEFSGLEIETYEIRGREDTISGISLASASQLSGLLS